jgi:hypothetical protein
MQHLLGTSETRGNSTPEEQTLEYFLGDGHAIASDASPRNGWDPSRKSPQPSAGSERFGVCVDELNLRPLRPGFQLQVTIAYADVRHRRFGGLSPPARVRIELRGDQMHLHCEKPLLLAPTP